MQEEKISLINFVSKKYTYRILKCLERGEKRFKDLKEGCEGEKMRVQRLKELESFGLIYVDVRRVGRRPVSLYSLSERGKNILRLFDEMKNQMKGDLK